MNIEEVELIFQRLENAIKTYSSNFNSEKKLDLYHDKHQLENELQEHQLKLIQMQNIIRETIRYLDNIIFDINKTLKC